MPVKKSKSARLKRELKKREPKIVEGPRNVLCLRGSKTSADIGEVLRDLASLKKPFVKVLQRRNDIHPFEDASSIEFLCEKNDCGAFAFASHSKKRPNNLVLGRLFDGHVLDMIEFGVEAYGGLSGFDTEKPPARARPLFLFLGDAFSNGDEKFAKTKSLLLDVFKGEEVDGVSLAGLHWVLGVAAVEDRLHIRCYAIDLKRSGERTPRVELRPMGFFLDLAIRRTQFAAEDLNKAAHRQPRELKAKKVKNITYDGMGDKIGRLHMERQDFDKLRIKHVRALKVRKSDFGGGEVAALDDGEDGGGAAATGGGADGGRSASLRAKRGREDGAEGDAPRSGGKVKKAAKRAAKRSRAGEEADD